MSADTVYVIAYSRVAFEMYCHEHGLNPLSRDVRHIATPERLRGLHAADIRVHSYPAGRPRLEWEQEINLASRGRWKPGDVVHFNDQTWARLADHHGTGTPWIKLNSERATTWISDYEMNGIASRNASFRFVWRHPEARPEPEPEPAPRQFTIRPHHCTMPCERNQCVTHRVYLDEPRSPEGGKGGGCCTSAVDSTTEADTTGGSAERPHLASVSLEPGATCGICEAYTGHKHYTLSQNTA